MSVAERLVQWLPVLWFVLVAVVLVVLWSTGLIPGLLQRMHKFGGFGLEFEFSEDSAKQTRDTIESQLEGVRKTIQRELEADVRARSLQDGLKSLLEGTRLGVGDRYRATIHIPDPLYENWLYQLLDYHPWGAGHGRTYSTRAGIIGLAWRMGTVEVWSQDSGIKLDELIKQWGMTHREAAQRRVVDHTKVMVAIPLQDPSQARHVGVLYLDAEDQHCFGATEADRLELVVELVQAYQRLLAKPLADLVESAMRRSPQLSLEAR